MKKLLQAGKGQKMQMKEVTRSQLRKIRMVAGNEKRFQRVIDHGVVHDWVAIGWIEIREATDEDYKKYPVVVD
jgi:hypothetical protein